MQALIRRITALWQNAQPGRNCKPREKGLLARPKFGRLIGESLCASELQCCHKFPSASYQMERSYLREFIEEIAKDRRMPRLSSQKPVSGALGWDGSSASRRLRSHVDRRSQRRFSFQICGRLLVLAVSDNWTLRAESLHWVHAAQLSDDIGGLFLGTRGPHQC